ncbi:MAG: O-antigen ligase family protein, partial [Flavobacteriales bacterium]|nr:O-antigen ligase family protein [Flavobacteriales bacterium]
MSALSQTTHFRIYFFGLLVMAVGLPCSNLLMSLSQIIIGINWIIEGDYRAKLSRFLANKPAVIFTSIFGLHLLGLLYTADFNYALADLRNKVPLLVLPFLIASSSILSKERIAWVFRIFVIAVVLGTLVCAGELTPFNDWVRALFNYPAREIMDARSISHFISHIRFALMICLSIFWLFYQAAQVYNSAKISIGYIAVAMWLITFMFLMESVTGLAIVFIVGFASLLYVAIKQKRKVIKLGSLALLVLIPTITFSYIGGMVMDFYKVSENNVAELPKHTAAGNLYFHDIDNRQLENGNYVWRYVCHLEIEPEWNKRSLIPFKRGRDKAGQFIEYTLFRYMTSRGLYKDTEGLAQLNDEEIAAIENGVANVRFSDVSNIESRIYGIIWQIDDYNHRGAPGGHSLSQRWEFWKTGLNVLKKNPLLGVGTGDVYNNMLAQYEADASLLVPAYRKHPHNQYLSIALAFGLIGL